MVSPSFVRHIKSPKAIVIVLGPLGVSKGSLESMADLHAGCCIFAASSPPLRFMLNWSLQATVRDILNNAQILMSEHPGIPIISHAFSNGGAFLLDELEKCINQETADSKGNSTTVAPWDNADLRERMKGGVQIFDSCPCYIRLAWDWDHFSDSFPHPTWSGPKRLVYAAGASMSLTMWSICTFAVSNPKHFWRGMMKSRTCMHQVFIYSKCDLLSDAAAVERLVDHRRSVMGSNCVVHAFDDSDHCRLHLDHQDAYIKVIEEALAAMQEKQRKS